MIDVRYIDLDLDIQCEKQQFGLVCPKRAIAEVYYSDESRYLCRFHLSEVKELEENEASK